MSRLVYSNLNTGVVQPVQSTVVREQVVAPGVQYVNQGYATNVAQTVVQQPQVVQEVVQPTVVQQGITEIVQPQQVVTQAVVEQPAVQVVQQAPQSQGPIQTTVQQGATQLGESRFEYIPKEKVWVEYEAVQSTEYVPKEVKLTDHYAVEHITEYHPKTYQDTFVDYYPVERNVDRVEYQQAVKKIQHPMVQSEITETILPAIAGPQTLIESKSQIVETGRTENVGAVQSVQQVVVPQQQVIAPQQVVVPQQQVIQQSVPVVGSRIVQQPAVQQVIGAQQVVASRVVAPQIAGGYVQSGVVGQQLIGTTPVVNTSRVVLK